MVRGGALRTFIGPTPRGFAPGPVRAPARPHARAREAARGGDRHASFAGSRARRGRVRAALLAADNSNARSAAGFDAPGERSAVGAGVGGGVWDPHGELSG